MSIFYGILWGVGGLTFGLSMRYLGVALGQSIALGTCAGFGTLFPAIFAGTNLFEGNGLILLLGVCITLSGIAIIGYAGSLRAKNMSEEEKRAAVKDFALTKGLLVALLAGVMSACFALGLDAGTPIKEAALAGGVEGLAGAHVAIEQDPDVLCHHFVPVVYIPPAGGCYLWPLSIIVCEGVAQGSRAGDTILVQLAHSEFEPLLFVPLGCRLIRFSLALAGRGDNGGNALPREGIASQAHLLGCAAFTAVQKPILAGVVTRGCFGFHQF